MKQAIKNLGYRIAPRWMTAWMSARARAHSQRVIASWGVLPINRKLVEHFGRTVQEGPFAGLTLTPSTDAEQLGPYLLGTYERELDTAWATILREDYEVIVDVGAKFGYYAVGLARRYPKAKVIAYDTDSWARKAIAEHCRANGTMNVEIRGYCDASSLEECSGVKSFIISDCEGYEGALFTPAVAQQLSRCTVLIETHDCFVPGVSAAIQSAFAPTHGAIRFDQSSSFRETGLDLSFLSEAERSLATREVRPPQEWYLFQPHPV